MRSSTRARPRNSSEARNAEVARTVTNVTTSDPFASIPEGETRVRRANRGFYAEYSSGHPFGIVGAFGDTEGDAIFKARAKAAEFENREKEVA